MAGADACPSCKANVEAIHDGAKGVCSRCMLMFTRTPSGLVPVFPAIHPSPPIYHVDLRQELPAGVDLERLAKTGVLQFARDPRGLRIEIAEGKAFEWTNPYMRLRDACVGFRLAEVSRGLKIAALVRSEAINTFCSQYAFFVSVNEGAGQLVRMVGGGRGEPTIFTPLTPMSPSPGRPGTSFEMRAQGAMLEGLCDGQRVAVAHDPVLGSGRCGFRFEAEGGAASVVLGELSIHGIME